MMKNAKNKLVAAYYTLCIFATLGMIVYCLVEYLKDKDVSSVDFKQFNEQEEYVYPTITLCFETQFLGDRLNNDKIGLDEWSYSNFLNGEYWQDNFLEVDFDNVTPKIEEYFLGIYVSSFYDLKTGFVEYLYNAHDLNINDPSKSSTGYWKLFVSKFYTSFRDTIARCVSFDIPNNLNTSIHKYELLFNASIFPESVRPEDNQFGVKIHYPNQYLSANVKKYSWKKMDPNNPYSYTMKFKLQNIVVINMRNKPKNPCNENWRNDDQIKRRNIMTKVGCQPPHWRKLTDLENCTNKEQMKKFYYLDLTDQRPPCKSIQKVLYGYEELNYIADNWLASSGDSSDIYFNVAIELDDSTFMEIKHVRAFDIQSLIGNSGGYFGLFTGYALLQVPQLISYIIGHFNKTFSQN